MANYLVTDTQLTSVADAIRAKTGGSTGLSFPDGMVSAVGQISTSAGEPSVVFIDYDGTVVATKTKAEINAMTSDSDLPANPSHTGLTAQGWNWTVTQLKAQLTATPDQKIYVGQMYVTTSGATEIDVVMQEERLNPTLTICPKGTILVDWGDGTTSDEVTGTSYTTRREVSHTYTQAGNYTIKISKTSGNGYAFYGTSTYLLLRKNATSTENIVYANAIQNIRIGNDAHIGDGSFYNCYSLANITIPSTVMSIGSRAFYNCCSLANITIPSSVTSIWDYAFQSCYSLANITIPSGVTSISDSVFYNCYSLANITIPSNVTSIGNNAFQYCYSLASITIPNGVTSIGMGAFQYCHALKSITIPSKVTSIGSSAFSNCYVLESIVISSEATSIGNGAFSNCYALTSITIPDGVTSIKANAFSGCYSLKSIMVPSEITSFENNIFANCFSLASITIPNNVTSLGTYVFQSNYSLASITIPSEVTSIGNSAFTGCSGMKEYHLLPENPPTLGTTVFANMPSDCVIYVPSASLSDYQTASGWSSYASQMVGE